MFVSEVMKEAGKFKRKKLMQELEEWRTSMRSPALAAASAGKTKPAASRLAGRR